VLVVAAHPDDEIIGMGARLMALRDVHLLHITDGSPLDLRNAKNSGCATRAEYAALRRRELHAALAIAGVPIHHTHELHLTDQHASMDLAKLTHAIARKITELGPRIVVTHPYEGGHPDHDAASFAVQHALDLLRDRGLTPPARLEMTSYHNGPTGITPGCFLGDSGEASRTLTLTREQRSAKQRMLDCFASQRVTLQYFTVDHECFRVAPRYDFSLAPHAGTLFYENYDWGLAGAGWRLLAAQADEQLHTGERV
jgi:LmbE family N-acetylglucosaminyl deacetylase